MVGLLIISSCTGVQESPKPADLKEFEDVEELATDIPEDCYWNYEKINAPTYANGVATVRRYCNVGERAMTGSCSTQDISGSDFEWVSCGYIQESSGNNNTIDGWTSEIKWNNFTNSPSFDETVYISLLCCS